MKPDGRLIYQSEDNRYRIMEYVDNDVQFDDLCGDTFNPEVNTDIPASQLAEELEHFKDLVEREGCFGYVLEYWDDTPGEGWTHTDSCWGFVGQYSPSDKSGKFNHYIVDEMKNQIKGDSK